MVHISKKENSNSVLYDQECKNVVSDTQLLSRILKVCVEEVKNYSLEEIEEVLKSKKEEDKELGFPNEGEMKADVFFSCGIPNPETYLYVNIEIQNKQNPRLLYNDKRHCVFKPNALQTI